MTARTKQRVVIGFLVLCLASGLLHFLGPKQPSYFTTPPKGTAYLFFRDGRVIEFPENKLLEHEWETSQPDKSYVKSAWWRVRLAKIMGWRGVGLFVPDAVKEVELDRHMKACATFTGQPVHVHPDLSTNRTSRILFKYGGRGGSGTTAWINANLEGIRTNGVLKRTSQFSSNVNAVIVVGSDGIRIIPESRIDLMP